MIAYSTTKLADWKWIARRSWNNLTPSYLIFAVAFFVLYGLLTVWCLILVLMFIFRATVSAVSCLVVPAFICIDILF